MPLLSTQSLVALLQNSDLVHSEEAIRILGAMSGDLEASGEVPSENLLATYSVRLEIWHTERGAYATELLDTMSKLCGRLEDTPDHAVA
jgi:hypothetical protein